MKRSIFQRRIPTLLALFILLSGLTVTSYLIGQGVFYVGRAGPNEEPQNIQITNVTQDSFTVAFTTISPTIAGVSTIDTNPPSVFFDTRDNVGNKSYSSHLITVGNLSPNSKYEFNILSNGTVYLNNGKNFTVKTAGGEPITSNPYLLSGKVILPDGADGLDILINAIIPNAAPVTAVTNDQGNYSFPANLLRNKSHDKLLKLPPGTEITLEATNGSLSSEVKFTYVPGIEIPAITLSSDYAFIADTEGEVNISTPSSELTIPNTPRPPDVKITVPKINQTFTDTKPQFKGTSFPNKIVRINIGPDGKASAQVRADFAGNWSYRPAVALKTGAYTITVDSTDAFGLIRSVSKTFTILPSGSQIAQSATPSATPTIISPTAAPTKNPTPSPALSLISPSPTQAVPTPTATPTISVPTPTPTSVVILPSPTPTTFIGGPAPEIPPTGPELLPIVLTSVSLLFIVAGSALLFIL